MTPNSPLNSSAVRPIKKPPVFDGRNPWGAYITQFEIVAEINDSKEAEKDCIFRDQFEGTGHNSLVWRL